MIVSLAALTSHAIAAPTPAGLADLVTSLPGLPASYTSKIYSGFIPLDAAATKKMFYWHVESQSPTAATDPLVLWTNGGPGCSGLVGFMTEQGPFRPTADGNLTLNPHAWNFAANMVFIEQPVGVGFSIAPAGQVYGDAEAAADNHAFLVNFIALKFPDYSTRPLYITSESYGGHYMPTLAAEIVRQNVLTNFKGFAVGNPLTSMPFRDEGEISTFANHQLIPNPLFGKYLSSGCPGQWNSTVPSPACVEVQSRIENLTSGLDPYALDFPVCGGPLASSRGDRRALLNALARAKGRGEHEGGPAPSTYFPENYTPCDMDWTTQYLNRADVQAAIHVTPAQGSEMAQQRGAGPVAWASCSNAVGNGFSAGDVNAPMMPVYSYLLNQETMPKLNMLVYSGDDDSVCSTPGTQQWLWGPTLNLSVTDEWSPWTMDSFAGIPAQISGYHVLFNGDAAGANGLHFATVHGAGHMVPATRPSQALELFKRFLGGTW